MLFNFDINAYEQAIKDSESGGDYSANNGIAKGAYQFTQSTLNYLQQKYNLPALTVFDNSTASLQDEYFQSFVSDILDFINTNNLQQYIGFPVIGANKYPYQVPINIYGLVAGAHIGGETGLRSFLLYGIDHDDSPNHNGTGTFISDYIAKFSDEITTYLAASSGSKKKYSCVVRYRRFITIGIKK